MFFTDNCIIFKLNIDCERKKDKNNIGVYFGERLKGNKMKS